MRRFACMLVLLVSLTLGASAVLATAPSGKEIMQPIDTSAGSISDPKKLFTVDLNKASKVSVVAMPLEVAFNQINATTGIEFGCGQGITPQTPVTVSMTGKTRDVLKALGNAIGIRFDVNGPTQLRAVRAREKAPRKPLPPPPTHP